MGKYLGNDGVAKVGSTAIGNVVEWTCNEERPAVDVTVLGEAATDNLPGRPRWSGMIKVLWDDDDSGQHAQMIDDADGIVTLDLYYRGEGGGMWHITGVAALTAINDGPVAVDTALPREFSFVNSGGAKWTRGTV